MQDPVLTDEMKIVQEFSRSVQRLCPDTRPSGLNVTFREIGQELCSARVNARLLQERYISPTPLRQLRAAIFQKPGNNPAESVSPRSNDARLYPSLLNEKTAFGPASTPPPMRLVKCTPRNGKRGSATG